MTKTLLCAAMMLLLLLNPDSGEQAAVSAIYVWGLDVVPSLFPYMVLCQSLSRANTRMSTARYLPFLLGMLGGSPSASAALSGMVNTTPFKKRTLLFLSACAGTISPMFFLGPVSKWFSSSLFAKRLIVSQYTGALLAGLTAFFFSKDAHSEPCINVGVSLKNESGPIHRSVDAVLNVGGCIIFFSTMASYIALPGFLKRFGGSEIFHALLEISGGLRALSAAAINPRIKEILAAGLCGFSGISILTQNHLFLRPLGISLGNLLKLGVLRGLFCAAVMALQMLM